MKKQGFLKGSAILMGMVIITKAIGLIYKLPLTRMLGGTGMGYYSSAFAVFTPIFAVVVSGIPSTISRMIAENYAFERYRNVRKIRRTALMIFSIIGIITCVLFAYSSGILASNLIKEPNSKWALLGIAPSILAATVLSVERGYYEGLKNMIPTAVSEIIETVFKLVLGLGFAYAVLDYSQKQFEATGGCFEVYCKSSEDALFAALPYITGASVLGVSIATCIGCLYIIISGRIHGDGITADMLKKDRCTDKAVHIVKRLIINAFPIALATVIATLTNMLDLITINSCIKRAMEADPSLFSQYISDGLERDMMPNFIYGSYSGLAVTVFGLVPTLTAMFGKSILPSLSEVWAIKDKKLIQKNLTSMLFITSIVAIPSGLGMSAMAREILEFLFGGRTNEISVSVMPLFILGLGIIFQAVSIPCFSVLQTIGKSHLPIIISITGGIIKFVGNVILIPMPRINICGAAIATIVSDGVICIWSAAAMVKAAKIKIDLKNILLKPLFASVLCVTTARLSYNSLLKHASANINFRIILAISIILGGIMYLFSLYLLCVSPKNQIFSVFLKKKSKKLLNFLQI